MSETSNAPQPAPDPAPRKGRTGRGVKIALAVSLAVNLLVAGLVGGAILGLRGGADGSPAIRTLGLGPFAIALGREGREEVRGRIEADLPVLARDRVVLGRSLREVQRALLTDPFDRDMAEAALMRSRRAGLVLQARGHAALLDTFEQMSPEERAEVAERLARTLRRIGNRSGG